ncbi:MULTISPECIES: ArsR/SmtB family transcription factor [Clostridium]|uniref:Transcriptional regulator, ArsR family n=1 Tax=Clostridium saccharoperbutylacetonicum N1-4(HMT) TaxID=931276 RepID=M1LU31_9CLOT|nr:metalloregulator ArsR/SmtB family transcription factor [Clostridium saccharoperbutylacetonicum]AGF56565.1 transcriptional regulator, ArsR family [Clostridium saccharoperbutylacetonicum N1-4(HMT)]AQR95239.1 transcriptional repressor SdpR [Clostridium saccharoperbutylacetonicum]NRT62684.1 ArsR family transcriptional regulator [Clostridium saccharoperbutylacetonicum]NSB26033.1 ArsR family transcriptional regulator [Clostridium saccharoperbutylacetonicum]NSB31093.1 ArsR family transcriptional r
MENKYEKNAKILKALSDTNRLRIIDLLSCGEMCACHILENFNFTQPTLSHHMKVLIDCGLVEARKDGIWNLYKLNLNNANRLVLFFMNLITENDECEEKDNKCHKSEDNK